MPVSPRSMISTYNIIIISTSTSIVALILGSVLTSIIIIVSLLSLLSVDIIIVVVLITIMYSV